VALAAITAEKPVECTIDGPTAWAEIHAIYYVK